MKRIGLLISLTMIASLLAACATPTPQIVKEVVTQVVEVEKEVTRIVAGTPVVEKVVETKIVEVEKVITATPEPAKAKVVRLGMNQELEFLNVMYTQGGNSLQTSKSAQRGLLFLDCNGNWIPELATEVPTVQNGLVAPDGTKITFNLRSGVTFHDGTPVTSADVKATWEAIMNPDNTPITRLGYNKIESIDTPDDLTVVLNFKEPFASWKILFDFVLPKHVIEENSPGLDESLAMRTPVGFGPFRIIQWKPGEFIEYEAFDDYWRGAPNIDRFFVVIYPSTEAELAALEVGEIDIAWGLRAANIPKLLELKDAGIINMLTNPPAGGERYAFNMDHSQVPIFADRRVRVALNHAVDKEAIVDKILHGYGEINPGTEWYGTPWAADLEPYEYDPDKAQQLLDEVGWRDEDGDGVREAHGVEGFEDGTPFSFKHTTTSGVLQREQVQLLVQQMFKEVGVDMVIENKRTAECFGTWDMQGIWSHGFYEMGGWSHGLRVPDPEISNRFLCGDIASEENPGGAQWHRYCNPEVDELLIAAQTEFDDQKRNELLFKAQELMHEDLYAIYLFAGGNQYGVNRRLENFELCPFTVWFGNIHAWDVKE